MRRPIQRAAVISLTSPFQPEAERPRAENWESVRSAVAAFVQGRTRRTDVAEDIAQETVLRLIEYSRRQEVASIYSLGFRIASNLIADFYRLEQRETEEQVPDSADPVAAPDRILMGREDVALLSAALRAMPTLRREVFVRRRLQGQSCAAIGRDLDLSVKAVEKHITRALADLDRALGSGLPALAARP
jgi:RNA polymerase sigma factor (sigma-70 family)